MQVLVETSHCSACGRGWSVIVAEGFVIRVLPASVDAEWLKDKNSRNNCFVCGGPILFGLAKQGT
jgi:hypothetical protein